MYTHVRARDLSTHAQWKKIKMALPSICGMTSAPEGGGVAGEKEIFSVGVGRQDTLEVEGVISKAGESGGRVVWQRLNTGSH